MADENHGREGGNFAGVVGAGIGGVAGARALRGVAATANDPKLRLEAALKTEAARGESALSARHEALLSELEAHTNELAAARPPIEAQTIGGTVFNNGAKVRANVGQALADARNGAVDLAGKASQSVADTASLVTGHTDLASLRAARASGAPIIKAASTVALPDELRAAATKHEALLADVRQKQVNAFEKAGVERTAQELDVAVMAHPDVLKSGKNLNAQVAEHLVKNESAIVKVAEGEVGALSRVARIGRSNAAVLAGVGGAAVLGMAAKRVFSKPRQTHVEALQAERAAQAQGAALGA